MFLIYAGNTAFVSTPPPAYRPSGHTDMNADITVPAGPASIDCVCPPAKLLWLKMVLTRDTSWIIYKSCPQTSRLRETLKFLLDHPRRCFVYMFPSTQTWFLLFLVVGLT